MTAISKPDGVEIAMRSSPILAVVSGRAVSELATRGTLRTYRRGTYLFFQGEPAEDVHFLIEGRLEVTSTSITGQRQLHTTLDTPQFVGEIGVLGGLPRSSTVLALEDSHCWVTPGAEFVGFLSRNFEATHALLTAMAGQLQAQDAFVEDLLFLDLRGRVAKRLLQLVSPRLDDLPEDGTPLPSVVTHADLASLCGGSRENISRILSELQRRGFVERRDRRYFLKDVKGLRGLAGV
jgi:CRP/FNR family transcriptional regulator/CRP/FNR family cyclic AMP-dependent transcriptional regulator